MPPMNSVGTKIEPRTYGSDIVAMSPTGGSFEGFSISSVSPWTVSMR